MAEKKVKLFKLAEEIKVDALAIIAYLKSNGIEGVTATSHVDAESVQDIKDHFSGKKPRAKKTAKAPEKTAETTPVEAPKAEPAAPPPAAEKPVEAKAEEKPNEPVSKEVIQTPGPKPAAVKPAVSETPLKPVAPVATPPPLAARNTDPFVPRPSQFPRPPSSYPSGPVGGRPSGPPGAGYRPGMPPARKFPPGKTGSPTETIRQHISSKFGDIRPKTFPPRPSGPPASRTAHGPRPFTPTSPPDTVPVPTRDHRPAPPRARGGYRAKEQEGKQGGRRVGFGRQLPPTVSRPAPFQPLPITKEITLTEGVTVKELAEKIDVKAKDIIKRLLDKGMFATMNQVLDESLAIDLSRDFGAEASIITYEEDAEYEAISDEKTENIAPRPPVVTIMGHVDHGKTSLLDAMRETNVTATEAGGITQHIGAYQVEKNGRVITFLDTPGHEAFTMMRARGAKVTDIVVLVVAADDGVMPQTLEAIAHARAAKVPIVVAINKIDKPNAQVDRVKKSLADNGLMAEDWGGETVTVEVSAKQRTNLDLLLEMILLVADLQGLKANPQRTAVGTILEAKLDKGRGPVATVLVQNGTLSVGDSFIAGAVTGKVRAMIDYRSRIVKIAEPSMPVEVLGLQSVPQVGDLFQVLTDATKVKQIGALRQLKLRESQLTKSARLTLEQLHEQMKAGTIKELPLILKADVQGSVEVLAETLNKIGKDKVKVKIIHKGTGAITETDVLLASASNAIIIGFSVRPERKASDLAQQEGVDIRLHTIIYNVTTEIKSAMTGMLDQRYKEAYLGTAEVRETFRVPKFGVIAGSYITEGKIARNSLVRLLRDNVVIYEGKVGSLRRFKDDASEVRSGFECGIGLENFSDIKNGDVIEAYIMEKMAPETL